MDYSYTSYNKKSLGKAKALRKRMTPEERRLWYDFLKAYPIHFYRQRAIDKYIVDFYCSQASLAIELDGAQHYEEAGYAYDLKRTNELEALGVKVLRFTNFDVKTNFEGVCRMIDSEICKKLNLDNSLYF